MSDFEKIVTLYEACLEPLGIQIYQRQPKFGAVIFSGEEEFLFFGSGLEIPVGTLKRIRKQAQLEKKEEK